VFNNSMFGTIRMHQERHYPARVSGTDLTNPDFVQLAESFGMHAGRVTKTEDFKGALKAAREAGKPALIEIVIDPEAIGPTATLSGLRNA
jgi:acetolactate synthase-1/2/3 large subunit